MLKIFVIKLFWKSIKNVRLHTFFEFSVNVRINKLVFILERELIQVSPYEILSPIFER